MSISLNTAKVNNKKIDSPCGHLKRHGLNNYRNISITSTILINFPLKSWSKCLCIQRLESCFLYSNKFCNKTLPLFESRYCNESICNKESYFLYICPPHSPPSLNTWFVDCWFFVKFNLYYLVLCMCSKF